MSDTQNTQETGTDSVVASEASTSPKPIPNSAAATDTTTAPQIRINPDDMHDLFEGTPDNAEDEDPFAEMRSDPNYAALIKDLEAIAKAAKELFSHPDESSPSDDLWKKIADQLPEKPDAV